MELREGSWHGQKEFDYLLERVISRARKLAGQNREILLRVDSAHDSKENREYLVHKEQVDFLITWNRRQQKPEKWLENVEKRANEKGWEVEWGQPREGKRVALFSEKIKEQYTTGPRAGEAYTVRRVIRITERRIDKKGQLLLIPNVTLEGWWTTLGEENHSNQRIIDLYKDHATSEQYHSEFKTDLDLERLPSGKFDTNDLVLTLGAFAYNILRWIGLMGLTGKLSPVRHPAKRKRIRAVMQELMYLASRVIESARQLKLRFSRHCPGLRAFEAVYRQLAYG